MVGTNHVTGECWWIPGTRGLKLGCPMKDGKIDYKNKGSVRGFPMVPLVILPMVDNGTIGRASGSIGITIGTNGFTNGTIGRTLNDIGIPLVPLAEPWIHARSIKETFLTVSFCWIGGSRIRVVSILIGM